MSNVVSCVSQEPLVSIIINNYNYGCFLKDAIDSALEQTHPRTEVIVVDDGSTDDSRDVIRRYGDRIIPVFKENGGQASAFNAGFARSEGDIVFFLDADDILLPGTARRASEVFQANQNVAKIMYRMEVIDATGARSGIIKPSRHVLRSGDFRRQALTFPFDMIWMATSGNAFAAPVLQQIFPIPEQAYGPVGADWYLSLVTALFGPVVFLDDVGFCYRVHGLNSYGGAGSVLDLQRIRQTIMYAHQTRPYIKKFADQLGLTPPHHKIGNISSLSFLANRLISIKLDSARHPLQGDTVTRLSLRGMLLSLRRFDVSFSKKTVFLLWFGAMAPAPKPLARWLAEQFLFSSRRWHVIRLLMALHGTQ